MIHLNFWLIFPMISLFLQRFVEFFRLLCLFSLPSLFLSPLTALLITQTFAFELPSSSLLLLFLPDSLIKTQDTMSVNSCTWKPTIYFWLKKIQLHFLWSKKNVFFMDLRIRIHGVSTLHVSVFQRSSLEFS